MSASKNGMVRAIKNYLDKVGEMVSAGGKPLIYESGSIFTAGQTKQYDIKTVFPTHALYDLFTLNVTVLLLDDEVGSPTNGMYINSEAVTTYGINSQGIIKITNASDDKVTLMVKITAPSIKL